MKRLYIMCALHRVLSESEHCVRRESPVAVGLPGPSLARKQKGRGARFILHTAQTPLITATATVLGNLEERGLEEKLMPEGSVFLEEQRKPLLRG